MCRSLLTIALAALFLAGSVQASVGWTQGFQVGGQNQVVWAGGVGSASSVHQGSFSQIQQASARAGSLSIYQAERGSLGQTATASGAASSAARQLANVNGTQDLLVDTRHGFPSRGQQDLGVKLTMGLVQPSGVGMVTGTQTYTGQQDQSMTTPCSTSSQSQSADMSQSGTIATQTNIDPALRNTINVNLHQSQLTNGQ